LYWRCGTLDETIGTTGWAKEIGSSANIYMRLKLLSISIYGTVSAFITQTTLSVEDCKRLWKSCVCDFLRYSPRKREYMLRTTNRQKAVLTLLENRYCDSWA
jgi:4-hydroxy-3-methylbut-2-enyl diphosphate reductase IspH